MTDKGILKKFVAQSTDILENSKTIIGTTGKVLHIWNNDKCRYFQTGFFSSLNTSTRVSVLQNSFCFYLTFKNSLKMKGVKECWCKINIGA